MQTLFQVSGEPNGHIIAFVAHTSTEATPSDDTDTPPVIPGLDEHLTRIGASFSADTISHDFSGGAGETLLMMVPTPGGMRRIVLAGIGSPAQASKDGGDALREAVAAVAGRTRSCKAPTAVLSQHNIDAVAKACSMDPAYALGEAVCAFHLGLYEFTEFKDVDTDKAPSTPKNWPETLYIHTTQEPNEALQTTVTEAAISATGVAYARDLVNRPPNVATPEHFAQCARQMADDYGFKVDIYDKKQILDMKMGSFASVFSGSTRHEPRLIVLEHAPKAVRKEAPIVLVGKGVTFDTGGISIKPSANMHHMKGDMGGAAAILGFFRALGELGFERRVVGIIPATDNMPDGQATVPGDVVTACDGQTIEIINTDAEGRLILCDAMAWGVRQYEPAQLIDVATLTGAAVVALGTRTAAIYANTPDLSRFIQDKGFACGDRYWPMPLWDSYADELKSDTADMKNVGSRMGGSIHAAKFLEKFVPEGTVWAHLDIAGPGFSDKKSALCPTGGTGVAVRTFIELTRPGG